MSSTRYQYEQKWFNDSDESFVDSGEFLNEFGREGYELDKVVTDGKMLLYIMKRINYLSMELSISEQKEFDSHDHMGEVY